MSTEIYQVECKWNKKVFRLELTPEMSFKEFQELIQKKTNVNVIHQKILNFSLKSSKLKIEPDSKLSEFNIKKPKHIITLIGNSENEIIQVNKVVDPKIEKLENEIEKLSVEFYEMKQKNLDPEKLSFEILKFDELFLQKMIQLDKINEEELLTERKRLILKIQIVLKDLDKLK
jgi:hypothetical protein